MSATPDPIGERFAADTAQHAMTILHEDGLYRHLRFQPREGSSAYWFDLITVPGALVFQGDGESFVFRRIKDMFQFFRSGIHKDGSLHINPGYWAEKLTTGNGRNSVLAYDQDLFERRVKEMTVEAIKDGRAPRGVGKAVREDILDDCDIADEGCARRVLDSFEFKGFRFHDAWEVSFRDYDWWFLWACHGIVWGISQYDAARELAATAQARARHDGSSRPVAYMGPGPAARQQAPLEAITEAAAQRGGAR